MAIVDTPLAGKADAESLLLYRKITWKLIPFLCLCYLAAYLDRINVGLAKLQMADALQLSEAAFGLGAGLFFVGYILFEVPSNLILQRVGAKMWIARIMITWGCCPPPPCSSPRRPSSTSFAFCSAWRRPVSCPACSFT